MVTPDDGDAVPDAIGHRLLPLEIVLAHTGVGARYGHDDYVGCGYGRAATLHLVRQGIRVAGSDRWSWDAPFRHTA